MTSTTVAGQESTSKDQSSLVEGLLDLLNEPPPKPVQTPPSVASQGQGTQSANPSTSRAGEGAAAQSQAALDPQLANSPLSPVRDDMLAVAQQLSKGSVNATTKQLQDAIVQRLDELIAQLQQSQQNQQPPESQSSSSQQSRSSSQRAADTSSSGSQAEDSQGASPQESGDEAGDQPSGSDTEQAGPAPSGRPGQVSVELADPQRLQQEVWGQLPEQVRQQMQSRMVERFLPSYRQQIEAYFRALLEAPPSN